MENDYFIYILKLEDGCWYIGRSNFSVSKRIHKHVRGVGSVWTKLHPVIDVHAVYRGDRKEETLATFDYMKMYGFDKVRGAGYTWAVYPENYPTPSLDTHTLRPVDVFNPFL